MIDVRQSEAGSARPGGRISDSRLSRNVDDFLAVAVFAEFAKAPSRGRSGAARFAGGEVESSHLAHQPLSSSATADLDYLGAYQ